MDGNHASRVFYIASSKTVSIAGLTITNGYAPNSESDGGGGIRNDHSTLTVSNCTVSGNFAPYLGGGIYNDTGSTLTMTMTGVCTFKYCPGDTTRSLT